MPNISYDHRAVTIDGKRTLLLSGSIHYPRSTPAMWPALMQSARDAGLNTIDTYVFWNFHERNRGVYDFSDRLDLLHYCRLAQEHGLHVILRIGPYICAEINYGGFPAWLRDVPGMQMRTYNEPFMQEMGRFVRDLVEMVRPMFASNGGPIILAQIENEYSLIAKTYGEEGQKYLRWCIDLCNSLKPGIPWIMCVGGVPGAIETINGWFGHEQIGAHFAAHADQPPLWTEHWPGWYDTYTEPHHTRPATEIAWAVSRFFAAGGAGMNYYMWHGGTNFNREGMFLQATSYDYDAPLDEYGLITTKANHLTRLHKILNDYSDVLLADESTEAQQRAQSAGIYSYSHDGRSLAFLYNDNRQESAALTFEGQQYQLPPLSVILIGNGQVLMNTAEINESDRVYRTFQPAERELTAFAWQPEPLPAEWPQDARFTPTGDAPVEALSLTHDETDYCWYTTKLNVKTAGAAVLKVDGVADIVHVFVDGQLVETSSGETLKEERGSFLDSPAFKKHFTLDLAPGEHELTLLCCSLGLIKGDWQIGRANMAAERKGFWGTAFWNDEPILTPWTTQPGTLGEHTSLPTADNGRWQPDAQSARCRPLTWLRTTFARSQNNHPLSLDLQGMNKGIAWLNGRCIGRYWLTEGRSLERSWAIPGDQPVVGQPTQRYYHLPLEWLSDQNTLVLFEEIGGDPATVRLCQRV
jgi:beta-galactosidase